MKFSYNIEASFTLLMHILQLWYHIQFWNGRAISTGGWVILPQFCHKLVAMATSLDELEKLYRIDNIHTNIPSNW